MSTISHLDLDTGMTMEIDQTGNGLRPLVLVHGFTGSRDDWHEQLPRLATHGLTIALDLRGHGGSSNSGDTVHYGFDLLARDVMAALDGLGVESCDLLGHSMGGILAQLIALERPEQVASLILMDTTGHGRDLLPKKARAAARALVEAQGMQALATAMESAGRAGSTPQPASMKACIDRMGPDAFWSRIRAKLLAMDPAAFTNLAEAFGAWPGVVNRLAEITCPTTIIVGAEDAPFVEPSQQLAREIAGAELVVINDAAHSPQLENPDAWFSAVSSHLDRARR